MTNRSRPILIALNLVVLIIAMFMLGPGRREAVALGLQFEVGDTHRFQMKVVTEAQQLSGGEGSRKVVTELDQIVRWKVTEVGAESATISVIIEQMTLTADGHRMNPGDLPSERTVRIRPDGLVLDSGEVIGLGPMTTSSGGFPALGQMTPLLPSGKVRPGDTWTASEEVPTPEGGTIRLESKNRLESLQNRGGKTIAEITSETEMPIRMSISFGDVLPEVPGATSEGAVPKLLMEGKGSFKSTALQEVETGTILSNRGGGTYEMKISFEGVEEFGPSAPPASSFTGKIDFEFKRLED